MNIDGFLEFDGCSFLFQKPIKPGEKATRLKTVESKTGIGVRR